MNKSISVLFLLAVVVIISGCSETRVPAYSEGEQALTPPSSSNQPTVANETDSSLFVYVDTKTEPDEFHNTMELYALAGNFDLEAFRQFCKVKKANATSKAYNYVVLFDDRINASFPSSPFTANYGVEEDKIKHIVAVFECNRMNGFCEMRVYDPNMWEGKVRTEKL